MKKKNQEALRTALNEFQDAYRVFLDDERKMQEAEERGISGQVSPTSPYSYQEWQIKRLTCKVPCLSYPKIL